MTIYRLGDQQVDLLPYVREAIATLGFVQEGAAEWLAGQIAVHADRTNGRSIRDAGTRLTQAERAERGLPPWNGHLSHEVWGALTDAGREAPVERFDDTCWRALRGARQRLQAERAGRILRPRGMFAGILMSAAPRVGLCDVGLAHVGEFTPTPPELPFHGCDRHVCGCMWRAITKTEAEKKGLASFY
ncbi:hypothetical protein EJV44_04560 [Ancylobacter aquaticus]|nr:hypothetical protein EJV44_04560 [Ancylobacter aquaticus]